MEKDKNKKEKRCDFDRCINYIYLIYIIIAAIFIAIVFIYLTSTADAKDLGVVGQVWEISESDPIEDIKNKLKVMESNGEIDKHNEKIKEEIKKKNRKSKESRDKKSRRRESIIIIQAYQSRMI